MSTTYKVIAGDTYDKIARKVYGYESASSIIKQSNPDVVELTAGLTISTPTLPENQQNRIASVEADKNELSVLIAGERFRFWDNVRLSLSLDKISTVDFSAPFESSLPGFKSLFRPFEFKEIQVFIGSNVVFTGVIVSITPSITVNQKIIIVSCYAKCGVIADCMPPSSSFPVEFNGQKLKQITESIIRPFGLNVDFKAEEGAIFDRVACKPSTKVLEFLTELAAQRGAVFTSNQSGNLVCQNSIDTGSPVATLRQGESPLLSVIPIFNSREYYSSITGIAQVKTGQQGTKYTVKNERLQAIRPFNFTIADAKDPDAKVAAESQIGRMFGSMASYTIRVSTWRDTAGNLWQPNTTIKLIAADAMIYSEYEFIIRGIDFERDSNSEAATINLVMPGAYNGQIPESLPWD